MKIHVIVDEGSKPISVALSPGNTHDSKMFNPVYDKVKIGLKGFMGMRYTIRMVGDRLGRDWVKATYL